MAWVRQLRVSVLEYLFNTLSNLEAAGGGAMPCLTTSLF
jgi:hypothetical protein